MWGGVTINRQLAAVSGRKWVTAAHVKIVTTAGIQIYAIVVVDRVCAKIFLAITIFVITLQEIDMLLPILLTFCVIRIFVATFISKVRVHWRNLGWTIFLIRTISLECHWFSSWWGCNLKCKTNVYIQKCYTAFGDVILSSRGKCCPRNGEKWTLLKFLVLLLLLT